MEQKPIKILKQLENQICDTPYKTMKIYSITFFLQKKLFQASSSNGEILVTEQEKSFTVDEEPWYYDRC